MKNGQKNQKKEDRVDEQRILKEINASFADIGVFDVLETHITRKKEKALKQA